MRKFIKNVSYLMFVNVLSFVISAVITFVVPKFLSIREYSYFQLYLFYLNYLGFCCIGWIDGIVLRYAGKYYEDIDKKVFSGQFKLYSFLEILIGIIVIVVVAIIKPDDVDKMQVFVMIGVAIILSQVNAFFRYLMQVVNYINVYAQNMLLEKIVYILGVALVLGSKNYNYKYLIWADLLAKLVVLVHMLIVNRELVKTKSVPLQGTLIEAKENISVGLKLLAANGSSLLIVGIIRYTIQSHWDVETFGKISLSLSVSNMFMVFVQAVGVSLFPMLRRIRKELLSKLYLIIRHTLMFSMLGMLILYYPAYRILSLWLPQYAESLHYMALMFPICIFESKIQLLIEPYLKSLRKEKDLLKINLSAVGLSLFSSALTIVILNNLNLAVLSIVIILGYRCVALELIIERTIKIQLKKDIAGEILMVISFIVFNWCLGGPLGVLAYALVYVVYVIINRSGIIETIGFVKKGINSELLD